MLLPLPSVMATGSNIHLIISFLSQLDKKQPKESTFAASSPMKDRFPGEEGSVPHRGTPRWFKPNEQFIY